ncbi:N-acetylmuramoyl-L-alanine amidase [Streptomyces sp. NBC_01352]|uniref:peptidoglycan recognition protein family protein n=1 Tax=Streptomyces sp. NBC_01352 TaxID=2903834 RepID=UPI002E330077|nr:N-acetylmuramoyl-L-alanine amidase [Streptomyces sp. NBC_01352]
MAWYPGAVKMELQPESDSQQAIRPTQLIVHSIAGPWTAKRTYEYWRDSTNLESHFGLGYAGDLAQYIGTQTRADANADANRRADGTGAVSIETASNTKASDPWTPEQIEQLIQLGVWLHKTHAIPLRICRTASDPGYGYHRLHREWSTSGTACPGDARVRQFNEVVFPGIVARATGTTPPPEEDDVTLTANEIEQIATATAKRTLTLDGVIANPVDDPANTHIVLATSVRNIEIVSRRTEAKVAAQAETINKLVDTVAQLAAGLGDLDPAAIVAELRQSIESVTVHLDVPEA